MSVGIKATNSSDLRVINCTFSGLDTDIELNNRFSQNNPTVVLNNLCKEILSSNLSGDGKKILFKEVVESLTSKTNFQAIKQKLLQQVGKKALEYFIQLAAAVSAGLILRKI